MNQGIKLAMIKFNQELESKSVSQPDSVGLVEIPQILQERLGFPSTFGELTIEQCIQIAAITDPEAFDRHERAKQEWNFQKLKAEKQTKH